MISITLNNGDSAEAADCEAAMLAARTLWDDAWAARTLLSRPAVWFRDTQTGEEFCRTTYRSDLS
jgi:hypothetical protein